MKRLILAAALTLLCAPRVHAQTTDPAAAVTDWEAWVGAKLAAMPPVDPSDPATFAQEQRSLLTGQNCHQPEAGGPFVCPFQVRTGSESLCRYAAVVAHVAGVMSARAAGEEGTIATEVTCTAHTARLTTATGAQTVELEQWAAATPDHPARLVIRTTF